MVVTAPSPRLFSWLIFSVFARCQTHVTTPSWSVNFEPVQVGWNCACQEQRLAFATAMFKSHGMRHSPRDHVTVTGHKMTMT